MTLDFFVVPCLCDCMCPLSPGWVNLGPFPEYLVERHQLKQSSILCNTYTLLKVSLTDNHGPIHFFYPLDCKHVKHNLMQWGKALLVVCRPARINALSASVLTVFAFVTRCKWWVAEVSISYRNSCFPFTRIAYPMGADFLRVRSRPGMADTWEPSTSEPALPNPLFERTWDCDVDGVGATHSDFPLFRTSLAKTCAKIYQPGSHWKDFITYVVGQPIGFDLGDTSTSLISTASARKWY